MTSTRGIRIAGGQDASYPSAFKKKKIREAAIIAYRANQGISVLAGVTGDTATGVWACPAYPTAANHAAALLARMFGVRHTLVLHVQSEGDHLVVQDGVGWQFGTVGRAVFETGEHTFASAVLSSNSPLIINDLHSESRFSIPPLFLEHGLVSGICLRIPKHDDVGVLAVFSTEYRIFDENEIACLESVAEMLSITMGCSLIEEARQKVQERIEQAKQEWEATVDVLPHFICLLDERGSIVRANRSLELWMPETVRDIRGQIVHDLLHPHCQDDECYLRCLFEEKWRDVMNGYHVVFEVDDMILKRQLEIQLRPTMRRASAKEQSASMAVMVMHDISRIKRAEESLKSSKKQLEDLVQERTNELLQTNEQLWSEILMRRRIEDELRQSENDMHLLSSQLLTAQEMERKRIAGELHDGISQSLMAIKFSIESAVGHGSIRVDDNRGDLVETILNRIKMAIEEVHRISVNLRPSMLDDLGIIPTIAWFCREFRAVYHNIHLDTHIDVSESDISDALKTVIYRLLQESFNNIAKHAMAKNVSVHVKRRDSSIEFLVQDDGDGFDLRRLGQRRENHTGSGIASMRERTEFSGGSFTIQSRRGSGTTIRALWSVHN